MQELFVTGAAALLFATIFLAGRRIHPFRTLIGDRRILISFGAGMAVAYVFVHVMPELHDARRAFVTSVSVLLRYEGMVIYFVALTGFLVFYGLDHLRKRLRDPAAEGPTGQAFVIHIGGFAAYVWLTSYLLVHNLTDTTTSIALFTVAIAVHFIGLDHTLRDEHGAAYEKTGRFVLAAMALLGWATGVLVDLPRMVLAPLLAFISGGVIVNSLIMELPSERDGRFLPFMFGGVVYALILIPLG